MTNKWLQLLEMHIEKGILGMAVLFAGAMVWMYLMQSPNTTSYHGKDYGPRELFEAIKADADKLDRAVRNAKPEQSKLETYSDKLQKTFNEGFSRRSRGAVSNRRPSCRGRLRSAVRSWFPD